MTGLLLVLTSGLATAQNIQVKGTVTDASTGEPIPFASVQLKGTMTGVSTDIAGTYAISVPSNGVLIFSSIGYTSSEIPVNQRAAINVSLTPDSEVLEDVIVVAYGTVKREAKTGSVASMKSETIAETPVSSVDKLLAGKMAGVTVSSVSGQPGGNSQIRIRGTSSVNAGNEPLWVVDGIPVMTGDQSYFTNTSNAMSAINPSDIESMTVLKDAAAASIYGSRAANGVILVTTKSGKSGKAKFTARAKFGASQLANDNDFGVMNGEELINYYRTCAVNGGYDPDDPTGAYYYPLSLLSNKLTNWMDGFTRLGQMQEYEINASGGNDKGKFYSSLSYQDNKGIVYGVDFSKITARVNSDYKLTRHLEMGTRVNLAYTETNDVAMQNFYYVNPMFAGLTIKPWTPFYDENGEYNTQISENSNTNPLYSAYNDKQWEKQYRVLGSVYLQYEPIKGLVFKTTDAIESTFGEGIRWWAPDPGGDTGTLQTSNTEYIQLTTSNTVTYSKMFGDHQLRLLAGQEAMRRTYHSYYAYAPDIDNNIPYLSTSVAESSEVSYSYNARTLLSFLGNIDYSYASKYYLQASVRADGSSLFGSNNKWGTFWSVGGSWNISNEAFMESTNKWLSLLKIRASYGVNGNNNISPYQAYGVYETVAYNGANGMLPSSPSNDNLSWELNKTWNAGIDFAFLDNRISGQIDVYSRNTEDMLLSKSVPQTSGFSSNFMNIGAMNNKGIEFQVEGTILQNKDWNWTVGMNIAFNRSKVTDLGGDEWMASSYDSRLRHVVGKSFYTFYVKDYYGVNPSTGQALWRADNTDTDDPDDYYLTSSYSNARYVYAGSPEPKYTGGFNTVVSWKGLSLSAYFEGKGGNKVYIGAMRYINSDGNQMNMNQTTLELNYWKNPGDYNVQPKPYAGNSSNSYNASSTRWIQKGDYLRVKDVTISYNLPKKILDKIHVSGLKIYVSGLNLYTFHDVDFWDPERGEEGMGWGIYPQTKTLVGGIELSF